MNIDLFAGRNKVCNLVQHFTFDKLSKVRALGKDKFAIPGGSVKTEAEIRKWASEYGYFVKLNYDEWDLKCDT